MNSKKKSKEDLNKPIDDKDDEQAQNVLNEDTVPYVVESTTKEMNESEYEDLEYDESEFDLTEEQLRELDKQDDDLSEEQLRGLEEAIKEDERGETISWEEFKKELDQWRSKL